MRKEYHESQKVEELLEKGLYVRANLESQKRVTRKEEVKGSLERVYHAGKSDAILLIKYYFSLGFKPREVKQKMIENWVNYNQCEDFRILNKWMAMVRRSGNYKLVDIDSVKVSREAMDWFIKMKDTTYDEWIAQGLIPQNEKLEEEATSGKLGLTPCKLLFTLYIWCLIQKQTKKRFTEINMKFTRNRLKKEAHIPKSKTFRSVFQYLINWGFIKDDYFIEMEKMRSGFYDKYPHMAKVDRERDLKYDWYFMDFYDIVPQGEEVIEVDFENPRIWFEQYIQEREREFDLADIELTHKCPRCGKYFKRKTNRRDECCADCKKEKERIKNKEQYQKRKEKKNG